MEIDIYVFSLRNQTPELNKTKEMIKLLKEKRDAQVCVTLNI